MARLGAVAPGLGPDLLEAVPALRGVVVLSTCNRLALLIDADSWADTGCPAALHPNLAPTGSQSAASSDLGETICAFLAERAGLPPSSLLLSHLVPHLGTSGGYRQRVSQVGLLYNPVRQSQPSAC